MGSRIFKKKNVCIDRTKYKIRNYYGECSCVLYLGNLGDKENQKRMK